MEERKENVVATGNQRRRIIVNPELQGRIVATVSWPPAVALAITALLLGVFSMRLLDEALVAKIELPSVTPILVIVIGFLVLSAIYVIFNALKFSHRIAGPMYRMMRTLESAKEGDLTARANLRPGDFLVEVADSLNEFLDHVERQRSNAAENALFAEGLERPVEAIDFEDLVGPQGRRADGAEESKSDADATTPDRAHATADVRPEHPSTPPETPAEEPDPSKN